MFWILRTGAPWRDPENGPHKRGLNTKLQLAVDAHGKPVRAQLSAETVVDCSQAIPLLEGLDAKVLSADKGYDTNTSRVGAVLLLVTRKMPLLFLRLFIFAVLPMLFSPRDDTI